MSALLEVRDLAVSFGGVHAVDNVTLNVSEGAIVGLIGPNGAGKTTLFECVTGFTRPDSGVVRFAGRDISHIGPEARARLGLIRSFQEARLFPSLTVFETILISLERRSRSRFVDSVFSLPTERRRERRKAARVNELIEATGLGAFGDKLIREISTGTRRITELACVLALEPRLLLLDEPSAGIAQKETEALGPLLRRIQHTTGATMFIIEHDIPLIMSLAETIIALESGHVIAEGPPGEIQQHPEVVASYLGAKAPVAPPASSGQESVNRVIRGASRINGAKTRRAPRRCKANTASGDRCRRPAVEASDFCALPAHRRLVGES